MFRKKRYKKRFYLILYIFLEKFLLFVFCIAVNFKEALKIFFSAIENLFEPISKMKNIFNKNRKDSKIMKFLHLFIKNFSLKVEISDI